MSIFEQSRHNLTAFVMSWFSSLGTCSQGSPAPIWSAVTEDQKFVFVYFNFKNISSIFALLNGMLNKSSTSVNMSFYPQHQGELKILPLVFTKVLPGIHESSKHNVKMFIHILYMCICKFKITNSITIVAYSLLSHVSVFKICTIDSRILLLFISSESQSLMEDSTASKNLLFLCKSESKDALKLESSAFW